MISIITCGHDETLWEIHERNVIKTIEYPCEYIRIDNRDNRYGLCAAYNEGIKRAHGDICVFVHEDALFMKKGWGSVLAEKFNADSTIGLIGIEGTQYLFADDMNWQAAGAPFTSGRIFYESRDGNEYELIVFSWNTDDTEVVVADGVFLAIRRELFTTAAFDDETFRGFHFYDLDICMQVSKSHRCMVTCDIMVKHLGRGNNPEGWQGAARRFQDKYRISLPASCTAGVPERINFNKRYVYNVRGKMPQFTIA
jgi:GT2 family glycosyltransferase